MVKKVFKWILVILAFVLLLSGITIALNYTFLERALTYPVESETTNSSWYTPKAIVQGDNTSNYTLTDSLTIDKAVLEDISNYAEEANSSTLLVLYKDNLQLEKYWHGSTKESTTNSHSMAKTVIGMLIGIAIDEGAILSVNESVATFIPEWADDERSEITIEDLLLMQSGLVRDDNAEDPFSDVVQMHLGSDAAKVVLGVPYEKTPATVFDYNNVNTQILTVILERATGEPIESYTSSRLWMPLGAADAGWWLDSEGGMPKTYCCLFAQAEDWMLVGQLLLQNGRWNDVQIIPQNWIEKMVTPSPLNGKRGYHIALNYEGGGIPITDTSGPYRVYRLDGLFKQKVWIVPDYHLVVVRVGENPTDWDDSYMVKKIIASLEE